MTPRRSRKCSSSRAARATARVCGGFSSKWCHGLGSNQHEGRRRAAGPFRSNSAIGWDRTSVLPGHYAGCPDQLGHDRVSAALNTQKAREYSHVGHLASFPGSLVGLTVNAKSALPTQDRELEQRVNPRAALSRFAGLAPPAAQERQRLGACGACRANIPPESISGPGGGVSSAWASVEPVGIEPTTPCLQGRCSPS